MRDGGQTPPPLFFSRPLDYSQILLAFLHLTGWILRFSFFPRHTSGYHGKRPPPLRAEPTESVFYHLEQNKSHDLCQSETSFRYNCQRNSPTAAPSVRCSDWCPSTSADPRTPRRRTSVAARWRPSRNEDRRYEPANATATTLCTDHATTAGTHGCNCHSASSASPPRRTTTAAYLMRIHFNYKSNSTDKWQRLRPHTLTSWNCER